MYEKKCTNVFLEPSLCCPNVLKPDEQDTKHLQNSRLFPCCALNAIVDAS